MSGIYGDVADPMESALATQSQQHVSGRSPGTTYNGLTVRSTPWGNYVVDASGRAQDVFDLGSGEWGNSDQFNAQSKPNGSFWGDMLKGGLAVGGMALGINGLAGLAGLEGAGAGISSAGLGGEGLWTGPMGEFAGGAGAAAGTGGGMSGLDWLNPDGSLNLENLAAQDYADFGVDGVSRLGNSLGYSQGVDWLSSGSGGILDTLKNYITQNPGSTIKTAAQALGLTNSDGSVNYGRLLSGLGSAALGAYGASQSADALERISDKYSAMGAPYRKELADLYADPSKFLSSDAVQQPVQQGTNALARSLSVHGNPTGSGTALQELQDYSANSMWGKLDAEKARLGSLGGLSSMPANVGQSADMSAAQSSGSGLNAIGYGLNQILNPQPTSNQLLQLLFRNSLT